MNFWDKAVARAILFAPPLATLGAIAFMLGVQRSTYLSTGEFAGSTVGLSLAFSVAIGAIIIGLNALWRVLRPEDWR